MFAVDGCGAYDDVIALLWKRSMFMDDNSERDGSARGSVVEGSAVDARSMRGKTVRFVGCGRMEVLTDGDVVD